MSEPISDVESCHCSLPVDRDRGRGMCTACDDSRCDAYPLECPEDDFIGRRAPRKARAAKGEKHWRKAKPLPGTIFDEKFGPTTPEWQRRLGLFYSHGVNPAAVAAGDTHVEALDRGRVRVYYAAIYLPPDQAEWPGGNVIPRGVICEHGGAKKAHTVKQIRHFDCAWTEVAA